MTITITTPASKEQYGNSDITITKPSGKPTPRILYFGDEDRSSEITITTQTKKAAPPDNRPLRYRYADSAQYTVSFASHKREPQETRGIDFDNDKPKRYWSRDEIMMGYLAYEQEIHGTRFKPDEPTTFHRHAKDETPRVKKGFFALGKPQQIDGDWYEPGSYVVLDSNGHVIRGTRTSSSSPKEISQGDDILARFDSYRYS